MRICTFDIETDGFLDTVSTVWCIVVKDHTTGDYKSFGPAHIRSGLDLLDTYTTIIGHNCIQFDLLILKKLYNYEYKGEVIDTLLMSRTQRPDRMSPKDYKGRAPHSVEAWGYRLGEGKKEHEEWNKFSEAMLERCRQDTSIQYLIYLALLKEGDGEGWDQTHKLNARIHHYLALQEQRGWAIDMDHLSFSIRLLDHWINRIGSSLAARLPLLVDVEGTGHVKKPFKQDGSLATISVEWLERVRQDGDSNPSNYYTDHSIDGCFTRINFRPLSLDSIKETKQFLLDSGWEPEKWNTNDAGERTSPNLSKDDPFNGIQGSMGRLVARRVQCKQRRSVLAGWRDAVRKDGRIPTPIGGVATTGRIRHKLVVNVPSVDSGAFFAKYMRQCFTASPGMVMVGCDSKGNQMRQLAGRMGDNEFTEAVLHGTVQEGTDLHSLNQKRSGAATRTIAKNFFYGSILFGAGNSKTARILETSVKRAQAIKKSYLEEIPKLKAVIDNLSRLWRKTARRRYNPKWAKQELINGTIRGLDNRPITVKYEKDLLCYQLQSDEAIQMGAAYTYLHKMAEKRGWVYGKDWGMLIWYHDEFQMECIPSLAGQLGRMAAEAIQWSGEWFNIACPHDGDYKIGQNWSETH